VVIGLEVVAPEVSDEEARIEGLGRTVERFIGRLIGVASSSSILSHLNSQIVVQFRTEPARIMPNFPDQYLQAIENFNPTSFDMFSRPPVSTAHPYIWQ
jgi:hypothetical protein